MAFWKVSNLQKKSCEERATWVKDHQIVTRIDGWRWGTYNVETTDDNPPDGITEDNEDGINMNDHNGENIVSIDMDNMDDMKDMYNSMFAGLFSPKKKEKN